MLTIGRLLSNVNTLAIVCTQWGDTGKGKFIDYFSPWADIIARGTGGANAGHTIRVSDKEHIFHLIPSGILHDKQGKINIIGNGVAFDPRIACEELDILTAEGLTFDNLKIAFNAHLVLPQHIVMDRVRESSTDGDMIGTTGKGIGPCYVDHYARIGLTVNDLLNPNVFRKKLVQNLADKIVLLSQADPSLIKKIMHQDVLENGRYYQPDGFFTVESIMDRYLEYGERLRSMITDTDELLRSAAAATKRILLEGAQGNLLSVDYGTYPFVTSSDPSIQGLARGVGLHERDIDLTLGIVKAFYMTRVGGGPFPTELGRTESEKHCSTKGVTRETEAAAFGSASVNDPDEFRQGIALRIAGAEYGATTGRPRRVGWLDLPLLRYSQQLSGRNIVLTKVDVLDSCDTIKVAVSYVYQGPDYYVGGKQLRKGALLYTAIPDSFVLKHCFPMYEEFPGWKRSIAEVRNYVELPNELRDIVRSVERTTKLNTVMISVGPDREQTIVVKNRVS